MKIININLDMLFLYNYLNKNKINNLIYNSEIIKFYIKFWNYIPPIYSENLSF